MKILNLTIPKKYPRYFRRSPKIGVVVVPSVVMAPFYLHVITPSGKM